MFIHLYEQDLQDLCGYDGMQPYWNWAATADNLQESSVFDGSDYSMSGDGLYNDTGPVVLSPNFTLPHGSGGGCVNSGPFGGMKVTMDSIPVSVIAEGTGLPHTAFDYNPTCLRRDLNPQVAKTYANSDQYTQALAAPDAYSFDRLLNGEIGSQTLGLHSGAHFTMGGQASQIFASPQDPIWFLLHAELDRLYTRWQDRHPDVAHSTYGTETALNLPPSQNVTLQSCEPDWAYLAESVQVMELMDVTSGPFCYTYE